jgi:hypothetical protein
VLDDCGVIIVENDVDDVAEAELLAIAVVVWDVVDVDVPRLVCVAVTVI